MMTGEAAFVLPSFENTRYINIHVGDHFGAIDIIGSSQIKEFAFEEWFSKRNLLQRQFSVSAFNNVEL